MNPYVYLLLLFPWDHHEISYRPAGPGWSDASFQSDGFCQDRGSGLMPWFWPGRCTSGSLEVAADSPAFWCGHSSLQYLANSIHLKKLEKRKARDARCHNYSVIFWEAHFSTSGHNSPAVVPVEMLQPPAPSRLRIFAWHPPKLGRPSRGATSCATEVGNNLFSRRESKLAI